MNRYGYFRKEFEMNFEDRLVKERIYLNTNREKLDSEKLNNLKNKGYKAILVDSTGYDHVDLKVAQKLNMPIEWLGGYGAKSMAQFSIIQLFKLMEMNKDQREISQFKVLVLGARGRTGKEICHLLEEGFGAMVYRYDLDDLYTEDGFYVLKEGIADANAIFIAMDLNEKSTKILTYQKLSMVRNKPYILNPVGRHGFIDHANLRKHLDDGSISGYACDEPIKKDNLLYGNKKCWFTRHVACKNPDAQTRKQASREEAYLELVSKLKV